MNRLVLFDIDGTLLRGGSLWGDSFIRSIKAEFPDLASSPGTGEKIARIKFGGKTDGQICREVLTAAGLSLEEAIAATPRIVEGYLRRAREGLVVRAHEMCVLPGVVEVLRGLAAEPSVCLGLLTGNVEAGAHLKLETAGLLEFFHDGSGFKLGAFADDHHDRYELPLIAVKKAQQRLGIRFEGKQVVVIGDTIHDVNCGKSIGVRAIAVGTGHGVTREELVAENPDFYFDDLSATEAVLDAIRR